MGLSRTVAPAFSLLIVCASGWAQTAQIQGTIQDSSGALVPAATVKVTQTDTGAVRSTASGADGSYVLANLPIGPGSPRIRWFSMTWPTLVVAVSTIPAFAC
ncbi:MAG TPA: carboxypeptidase-like regulatory domain-containing protein [Bryobacteraceae bacterium]|nr:carboxypeptidase-like regulatory domain-containing protein [Bryobacteraceae bacterium]